MKASIRKRFYIAVLFSFFSCLLGGLFYLQYQSNETDAEDVDEELVVVTNIANSNDIHVIDQSELYSFKYKESHKHHIKKKYLVRNTRRQQQKYFAKCQDTYRITHSDRAALLHVWQQINKEARFIKPSYYSFLFRLALF